MRKCIEHREFIPVAEVPTEMPEGIAVKYCVHWPGEAREITPDSLKKIMKTLRKEEWTDLYLSDDEDLEECYMNLEGDGRLYSLGYVQHEGLAGEQGAWWSTYDPDFLGSDEETDIPCSDGQSIIYRETTTADKEAVMTAVEYFIRTGKLWDGIPWMKQWDEWIEE